MAAGLGFKDFVTGEVLTAADVDGYLMQGVWVFASAAARDAAVTSPQEGNFAYLKDTNVTTYYTGSAWANLDTTGMTNPMTTTGDTIYSSSGSTPARLGIGTTGQVLTVSGGVPSWATASSGGMTLISETTASALSSLSFTGIAGTYKELYLVWEGIVASGSGSNFDIRLNNDSTGIYAYGVFGAATNNSGGLVFDADSGASATSLVGASSRYATFGDDGDGSGLDKNSMGWLRISNYASASKFKHYMGNWWNYDNNGGNTGRNACVGQGVYKSTSAVTSVDIVRTAGSATFSNATDTSIRLYGLS
jgi:hypothetical protein